MVCKHFDNVTDSEIELTLYLAGRRGQRLETFGSRVITIASGDSGEFSISDLRHSFLQGICIKTRNNGESLSLQRGTHDVTGPVFSLLNENDSFRIGAYKHSFAIEPVME